MDTQNQQGDPATEQNSEKENQSQQSTNNQATPPEQQSPPEQPPVNQEPSFNKESLLADLHKERNQRKELTGKVSELTERVAELDTVTQERDALQSKYDRLESFLEAFGGGISKALDSRSFVRDLFESDKDVADLVAEWHKNNPSNTVAALSANSGGEAHSTPSINDLLRAAK